MAQLTPQNLAFLVRSRLGETDDRNTVRYIAAIPSALKAMARKVAADPFKRDLLTTNPEATTIEIEDNAINLTTAYEDFQILKEYLDLGAIYHESKQFKIELVKPHQKNLSHQFSDTFIFAYVEGSYLKLIGDYTGELAFAVPYFPLDLSAMPESDELESVLIDKIIELCNVGSDTAQDGEK